jgi:hypothetical protein
MLRNYQSMFEAVADFTTEYVNLHSPTSHPTLQNQWMSSVDTVTDELFEDLDTEDKMVFQKVQGVFTRGLQIFMKEAKNVSWIRLSAAERNTRIAAIFARPQVPQRTPAWYKQGQEILTASEFAGLYGSERAYASLVLSKAVTSELRMSNRGACPTFEMSPFSWGIRFEPVVKSVFENAWGVTITDCGRITHGTDPNLAASPDGIFTTARDPQMLGRLIEIKCPISRPINQGIPFEYWCQMQIQMEVCDIDECQYLEVSIHSAQARKAVGEAPANPVASGLVYLLCRAETDYIYAYTEHERDAKVEEGFVLEDTIPWSITQFHKETVQRDRRWFAETAPMRNTFWTDVARAKRGEFPIPPPATPRQKSCRITDSPPS